MKKRKIKRALNEAETAAYIGMSRSFLRRARMEGNNDSRTPSPPFIKIGRSVRYINGDLDIWLDKFSKLEHVGQYSNTKALRGR